MKLTGRRDFLAGAGLGAGAYLLDPIGRALIAEARGQSARKRFVIIGYGCGLSYTRYEHDTGGATEKPFGPDLPLRPIFAPFEPYRADLIIAERFFVPPTCYYDGLHGASFGTFSLRPPAVKDTRIPGGPTIDRFVARAIGAGDPFSSINLGHTCYDKNETNRSADGPATIFPVETDPKRALATIFGGAGSAAPGVPRIDPQKRFAKQKGVLDLVRGDVARMQARLAPAERAKLDQYLTSLRELEMRLTPPPAPAGGQAAVQSCAAPAAPALATYPNDKELVPEAAQAFTDVVFTSLACARTHVATFWMVMGAGGPVFKHLGDIDGQHKDNHMGETDMLQKIDTYVMSVVAGLYAKLKQVPEGNGTMADNTVIMLINDAGGQHHDGNDTHMVALLGRAGGALRTGRYFKQPKGKYSLGAVYTAVANAVGAPTPAFGDGTTGPLPGLLA